MKRTATGVCVAAVLGFAVSLGAQPPTTPPSTPPSPTAAPQRPMSSDRSAKDINVTGCLSKSPDGSFTLTNAKVEPAGSASTSPSDPSAPTAGTTGTSGTATAGTSGTSASAATAPAGSGSSSNATWTLSGGSDLDKHVGHKITVTGRAIAATASASSGAPGTTGTSGSTPSASASATQQKLDVQSVKMIAASCS
jgi:hypothetical protein